MRRFSALFLSFAVLFTGIPSAFAGVVGSDEVVLAEQQQYSRQQILSLVDSAAVQAKLVSLGVDADDARSRIANMTDAELTSLNAQMQDMPAGGVVGTVFTVLIVIAVLDMLGITDVFSFINPIT